MDVDGRSGIRETLAHLVSAGHSSVGFIGCPEGSFSGDERFKGYVDGLTDGGLLLDADLVVRTGNGFEEGQDAIIEPLARAAELTACCCGPGLPGPRSDGGSQAQRSDCR